MIANNKNIPQLLLLALAACLAPGSLRSASVPNIIAVAQTIFLLAPSPWSVRFRLFLGVALVARASAPANICTLWFSPTMLR